MTTETITVNGEARDWRDQSLQDLLREFEIGPERSGVAVARNADVVPRGEWQSVKVQPGDRIEIVHIVRGG